MSSAPAAAPTILSAPLLGIFVATALGLAAGAPLYYLIFFDLTLTPIVGFWTLAGIRIDPSDVILACLALAMVARVRFSPFEVAKKLPYLFPWLALGVFTTLSYVYSPWNEDNLTDPVRIAYQVYRYCWKPLLFYPICLLFLRDLRQARHAWTAILIGANICAAHGVYQGYTGVSEPPGPFETGNELAAVLVVPFVIAVSGLIFPTSRFNWLFSTASVLLLARAILFSASRGGMVSVMVGAGVFGFFAMFNSTGRTRILKLVPVGLLSLLGLLALRPDILDRPTVRHAFSLFEGTRTANIQWRIRQRWPHFFQIAVDNPVLGTGTYVDESLSDDANTPHNGYLALAVKYGFPVLALFLFFILRLMRNCQLAFRRSRDLDQSMFYLTMAAAMLGLATHNIVETTLPFNAIQKYFWMFCALGAAYAHLWKPAGEGAGHESPSPSGGRQPSLAPTRQPA